MNTIKIQFCAVQQTNTNIVKLYLKSSSWIEQPQDSDLETSNQIFFKTTILSKNETSDVAFYMYM